MKLMGNAMILGLMEMLAEVYALGDATGIEPDVFQEFVGECVRARAKRQWWQLEWEAWVQKDSAATIRGGARVAPRGLRKRGEEEIEE